MNRRFAFLCLFLLCFITDVAHASWLSPEPVIKRMYADFLGRQPNDKEIQTNTDLVVFRKNNLFEIMVRIYNSDEFKKRSEKLDDIELAYLRLLNRPADPEGHQHYLDKLQNESMNLGQIEEELANSAEGKKAAVRQLYLELLYRDADEPGLDNYTKGISGNFKFRAEDKKTPKPLVNRGKELKEVEKSLLGSYERQHFVTHYPAVVTTVEGFFDTILGRKPDPDGFKHHLGELALNRNLFEACNIFMGSDEFKKRNLTDLQKAYIKYILRSATKKEADDNKQKKLADVIKDLKVCDEGIDASIRVTYWQILNRDPDAKELTEARNRMKFAKNSKSGTPFGGGIFNINQQLKKLEDAQRDIAEDLLRTSEAQNWRRFRPMWQDVVKEQLELLEFEAVGAADFVKDIENKVADARTEADKLWKDLETQVPPEFSQLKYLLDQAFGKIDLDEIKKYADEINKLVAALGDLVTGEVHKLSVELLGRPAPDFYQLLNSQASWKGADQITGGQTSALPGKIPATVPGTSTSAQTPAQPAVPGLQMRPGDEQLIPLLQQALQDAKDPADLQRKMTAVIVNSQVFKDLEPNRREFVSNCYLRILKRPATDKELAEWMGKLNTGAVLPQDLADFLGQSDEYKKLAELLSGSKLAQFLPAELKKTQEESKSNDARIKDNTLRLSDIEGFSQFDFAKDVSISDVVKTEDQYGFCYSGKASVFGLKNVKVFAKKHPTSYGYAVYVFGAFFDKYELKSHYDSLAGDIKDLVTVLSFEGGALIHGSENVTMHVNSLPTNIRSEFTEILKNSQHQALNLIKGANIVGTLKLASSGSLSSLKKLLPDNMALTVHGHLAIAAKDMYFNALIPAFSPKLFPKDCKQVEPVLEITGKPSVGVNMSMEVTLPKNQLMKAKVGFGVPLKASGTLELYAALEGIWSNAFNIDGFKLGNLVFTANMKFVPTFSPTFGFAGDFRMGDKIVRVAAEIPATANPAEASYLGSINSLGTRDLLNLLREMGGNIQTLPFDPDLIGVKDVQVSVSTTGVPRLGIPQGYCAKGRLFIQSGEVANIDAIVSKARGISILGFTNDLKLGPLAITGTDPKKGAKVDIQFPYTGAYALIDGKASFFGISDAIQLKIDRRGMGFVHEKAFSDAWRAKMEIIGSVDARNPDFKAKYEVKSDIGKELNKLVVDVLGGKVPKFVTRIFNSLLVLRKAGFDGSLAQTIDGNIPDFYVDLGVMGKNFTKRTNLNISSPKEALKNLARNLADNVVIQRVKEFVKEYLAAILEFFKKIFGGRKDKMDSLLARYRNAGSAAPRIDYSGEARKLAIYFNASY